MQEDQSTEGHGIRVKSQLSDLPWEMVSQVYSQILDTHQELSAGLHGLTWTSTDSGHFAFVHNSNEHTAASVLTSKAHNEIIGTYLRNRAPMHLRLPVELHQTDESAQTVECKALQNKLPCQARSMYVVVTVGPAHQRLNLSDSAPELEWGDVRTMWPVDSQVSADKDVVEDSTVASAQRSGDCGLEECGFEEEDITTTGVVEIGDLPSETATTVDISTSDVFEDLKKRLLACKRTEHIVLACDNISEMEDESAIESNHRLFETLLSVVESMHKVKRYSVHVAHFAAFGSRQGDMNWASEDVVRVGHETPFWQHNEHYQELLKDCWIVAWTTG